MARRKQIETPEDARRSVAKRLKKRSRVCANGCVEWTGNKVHRYGQIAWWDDGRAKQLRVHRAAFALCYGLPFQFDGIVCHRCDNPLCINPDHLLLGTQADNIADMMSKGRHCLKSGGRPPQAKLTDEQVRAIRSDSRPTTQIARDYGINQKTAWAVQNHKVYKSVS